jgi:MoxR-like ATPase
MVTSDQRDALGALWGKAEASLSNGAYGRPSPHHPGRTNIVHERNLSRYSCYKGTRDGTMAMGIVEALLAVLIGNVRTVSCEGDALLGRLAVESLSSATTYAFTWNARDPPRLVLGGFPSDEAGKPRPTYHSALCGLVQHWAVWQVRSGALGGGDEVLQRWWALLTALGTAFPTSAAGRPWSRVQVAQACQDRPTNQAVRDAIEGMADAFYLHLRYLLPDTAVERQVMVQCADAIGETQGYLVPLDPRLLLIVPAAATAVPNAEDPDTDLDLSGAAGDDEKRSAVAAADAVLREGASALVPTADTPRIRAALEDEGAVFLVGPAGVGKTEWAQYLARELYDGFEKIRFSSRLHEEDLYGTHVQRADGHWALEPGPLVRWAERVAAGRPLVLILDELPRAHGRIPDALMAIVDTHSAADLEAEGRPLPSEPGPYHVVDVPGYATFILPARRVKIVATGNIGESFRGLDLSDPAFLDRWTSWLQLANFTPDEKRAILARHLGLAPEHPLISALIGVARDVAAYRETAARELGAAMTMRTLIRWGKAVVRRAEETAARRHPPVYGPPFRTVAQGQWLDKVCARKGDGLDPDVYAELLRIVADHAARL